MNPDRIEADAFLDKLAMFFALHPKAEHFSSPALVLPKSSSLFPAQAPQTLLSLTLLYEANPSSILRAKIDSTIKDYLSHLKNVTPNEEETCIIKY